MGFSLGIIVPVDFYDKETGYIDYHAFRQDLRGKLIKEHCGAINGISTESLAECYYHRRDLEPCLKMEQELQFARAVLRERGIILKNTYCRWHIVDNAPEAYGYLKNRAMRMVRAHGRVVTESEIALKYFPELEGYSLPKAIAGLGKPVKQLKEAIQIDKDGDNDAHKQLP